LADISLGAEINGTSFLPNATYDVREAERIFVTWQVIAEAIAQLHHQLELELTPARP